MANKPAKILFIFFQKRFFSAKPTTTTSPKRLRKSLNSDNNNNNIVTTHPLSFSFTVQYLINSCGLPLKSAISASKKLLLEPKCKEHYDSVITFLKTHEFSDTLVSKLVEKQPAVLNHTILSKLEAKIRYFSDNGVPETVVPEVIVSNPNILWRSLDAQLKPVMEFLKEYIGTIEKILVAIDRGSWILTCDLEKTLQPNVDFLIKEGVPRKRVADLMVLQPRCIFYHDLDRMVHGVNMVKGFGIKPKELRFIQCLRVILSLSFSTWDKKVKFLESMGWDYDDVISTFMRSPHCLSCSEKKVRRVMDFLINTAKIDRDVVIGYPKLLSYSIEKRIAPRYAVWKVLQEKGFLPDKKFVWMLNKSEKEFVDQYVTRFSDQVPFLLSVYKNKKMERVSD